MEEIQVQASGQIDQSKDLYHSKLSNLATELVQMPQVECPVTHHFGGGSYVRETLFPAGTVVIGKWHRFETVNILMQGTISILNTDGTLKKLTAPQILISPPGAKVGFAHDDVIWVNVHPTEETDLEIIENIFIDGEKDFAEQARQMIAAVERKEIT